MRSSLKRIVSQPDLSAAALKAYTDFPALEDVTVQFLNFVPPWILVGAESLAESTIRNALEAYDVSQGTGDGSGHRKYIEKIAESAKALSRLRVSVKNDHGQWDIWNYDQPLLEYMQSHNRSAVQIRERETPTATGPILIKLLAAISSTSELEKAEIDISELLARGTAQ